LAGNLAAELAGEMAGEMARELARDLTRDLAWNDLTENPAGHLVGGDLAKHLGSHLGGCATRNVHWGRAEADRHSRRPLKGSVIVGLGILGERDVDTLPRRYRDSRSRVRLRGVRLSHNGARRTCWPRRLVLPEVLRGDLAGDLASDRPRDLAVDLARHLARNLASHLPRYFSSHLAGYATGDVNGGRTRAAQYAGRR
jgi:hypothetical protein